MKNKILLFSTILLFAVALNQISAQTNCVWVVKLKEGKPVQKIGVSISLVKLLAGLGGDFNINGVKMTYKSLLQTYSNGSVKRIKENFENSETNIYGGQFNQQMNERSQKVDRLFIESTDSGSATKINKLPVRSIEAVGILLAMIGSSDLDNAIDKIEDALEQGGVLYIDDYEKDSRLWIYVN
jgi:hypothetical protein